MKKALFTILLAISIFPLLVKAQTKTYNICKEGCEYDSILVVWSEINHLTEDYDVVVNFKDGAVYSFLDFKYADLLMSSEWDTGIYIYNPHVKSFTMNGYENGKTVIDVLGFNRTIIEEILLNTTHPLNTSIHQTLKKKDDKGSFAEYLVYEELDRQFDEEVAEKAYEYNDEYWEILKANQDDLKNIDYLYSSSLYCHKHSCKKNIDDLNEYNPDLNYYRMYNTFVGNITSIYYENFEHNDGETYTCYRNDNHGDCPSIKTNINKVKAIKDQMRDVNNQIYNYRVERATYYYNLDKTDLINEKDQELADGTEPTLNRVFEILDGTPNTVEGYDYNLASLFGVITNALNGVPNAGDYLDEVNNLWLRLAFCGVLNTDFEINNISLIGSFYFGSVPGLYVGNTGNYESPDELDVEQLTKRVTGSINNSDMPYLLFATGTYDIHVKNSVVNRIYSFGLDGMVKYAGEEIDLNEYNIPEGSLSPRIYLDKSDTTLHRMILVSDTDLLNNILESFIPLSTEVNEEEVPSITKEKITKEIEINRNNKLYLKYILKDNYIYDINENKYYFVDLENMCDPNDQICQENNGLSSAAFQTLEGITEYFRESTYFELFNGKVYFEEEQAITLKVKDTKDLKEIFESMDINYNNIEWSIKDPTICKIENGKVLGTKLGTTEITATYGRNVYVLTVTVTELAINPETKAFGITLLVILFLISIGITIYLKQIKQINYFNKINTRD